MANEEFCSERIIDMKLALPIIVVWLFTFLMMAMSWSLSHGDVILYKVPTGEVVEAFREPIPLPLGYAQVAVPNADLILWPAPQGCTRGNRKWANVVIPVTNPPSLTIRTDLKFFRCQLVSSAIDVDRVASEEVEKLQSDQSDAELLRQAVWAIYTLALKCPLTDISAQCNDDRTKAKAIETNLTGLNVQIEAIRKEAADFKSAQGW